jgi:holin-like protein
MLKTLATLLLFQCLGDFVSFILNISVPGPVIGMLLLLLALRISTSLKVSIEQSSIAFLKCLSLLFVPAGVGVMVYASSVQKDLVALSITIVVSTALTLSVTALTVKTLGSVAVRKLGEGGIERIGMLILQDRRIARRLNDAVRRDSSSALWLSCA